MAFTNFSTGGFIDTMSRILKIPYRGIYWVYIDLVVPGDISVNAPPRSIIAFVRK